MVFLIGVLTFFTVLDCLVLTLLVLMQLPKKEAGAGLAFGGAATDALFGAGSGNFLTKATKYSAIVLFLLAIVLSILQRRVYYGPTSKFRESVQQQQSQPTAPVGPASTAARQPAPPTGAAASPSLPSAPAAAPAGSNFLLEVPASSSSSTTTNSAPVTSPPK